VFLVAKRKVCSEMNTKLTVTPELIVNLVNDYLEMGEYPDWGGLQKAFEGMGLDSSEVFDIMYAIRQGEY
jgi:hypothetical protein